FAAWAVPHGAPKPASFAVRIDGAGAATDTFAGLLVPVNRRTMTSTRPMFASGATCATINPGDTEYKGAGLPPMVTCTSASRLGHGVPAAVAPSAGLKLRPAICTSPPCETVPGAGAWVKKLVTPRALMTGAVGGWP